MVAKGYKRDIAALRKSAYPYIVFWNFNHFLVVEGYRKGRVYLNDPAAGPRSVPFEEFDRSYTGVMMALTPGPDFKRGGCETQLLRGLWKRLRGSLIPVFAAVCAALLLVAPGLAVPAMMAAFVDRVLVDGQKDWGRPLVLGMLIAALLRGLLGALEFRILRRLQIRLAVANSGRFVKHLLKLPASFYAQRYAGEVSSRIALNDNVAAILSGQLATTSIDALMMVFYMVVMWEFNRSLTLVAVAFAAANFGIMQWVARRRTEGNVRLSMAQGRAGGVGIAGLQSIRTLKASGLESDFFSRWAGFFANMYNSMQELSIVNYYVGVVPPLLLRAHDGFGAAGGRLRSDARANEHRHAGGLPKSGYQLSAPGQQPGRARRKHAGTRRRPQPPRRRAQQPSPRRDFPHFVARICRCALRGHVEFRNVTFGYSPVAPPLISNLSFHGPPGPAHCFCRRKRFRQVDRGPSARGLIRTAFG